MFGQIKLIQRVPERAFLVYFTSHVYFTGSRARSDTLSFDEN